MLTLAPHPDIRIRKLTIGREQAPLLVIDNLVDHADQLIHLAAEKRFVDAEGLFPGVRVKVPLTYQQFFIEQLRGMLTDHFDVAARSWRFSACHFSLVTTPSSTLTYLQRIPHVDSFSSHELAFIHYLFKSNLGGTAFYRHRKTGFEVIDQERRPEYWQIRTEEASGPHSPPAEYITGDTPLYEQVERQEGVFNRVLVYRRNSLHAASIERDTPLEPDPRSGRLSINGFLTVDR